MPRRRPAGSLKFSSWARGIQGRLDQRRPAVARASQPAGPWIAITASSARCARARRAGTVSEMPAMMMLRWRSPRESSTGRARGHGLRGSSPANGSCVGPGRPARASAHGRRTAVAGVAQLRHADQGAPPPAVGCRTPTGAPARSLASMMSGSMSPSSSGALSDRTTCRRGRTRFFGSENRSRRACTRLRSPRGPQDNLHSSCSLEFPRFDGHLTAGPSGLAWRMSVDAQDPAVFAGVQA